MRACAEHPSPTGPLSGVMPPLAWLVGLLLTPPPPGLWASWGGLWRAAAGVGSETEPPVSPSSFPSAQRQTRLLRGAPLPAECGPPAQPQRDGKPAGGCGRAPGCPAGGGSRGAHPGAEVHHCSLSTATNKCLGRSLGQRGFSGLSSGRWGGKGGAPAGQAPPDCPQVRGGGLLLENQE